MARGRLRVKEEGEYGMYLSREFPNRLKARQVMTLDRSGWERAPGWADHECPNLVFRQLPLSAYQLLQDGDDEAERLPAACDRLDDDVLVPHEEGDGGRLDGGHLREAKRGDDVEAGGRQRPPGELSTAHTSMG